MKLAADFRAIARRSLTGNWAVAVIAGILASICGAISSGGSSVNFESFSDLGSTQTTSPFTEMPQEFLIFLTTFLLVFMAIMLVVGVAYFILGSVVGAGYSQFNLDLVDRQKKPEIGTLFAYFKHWKTLTATSFLKALYVFLWSLLFIIPGIIAGFSYAMTDYILAENPEMTASEALEKSKSMMYGNRWRLFCLRLSFIGWDFLCIFTLGIGHLWLTPYKQAAEAAFYRDISGTECYIPDPDENVAG